VVDTPGLREIGFWGLPPESIDECFPELRPFLEGCRFADCAHVAEPGCAVRDAVAGGAVSAARYDSYVKLREEILEGTPPEWPDACRSATVGRPLAGDDARAPARRKC
jgi:ribosome biogenesis GTPase